MDTNLQTLQDDISKWGRMTFGATDAQRIALRMNVEVAELLNELAVLEDAPPIGADREAARIACVEECADVLIMLTQVCDALGGDLLIAVHEKMAINRKRTWGKTDKGKVQHVETFVNESCGLTMELDKFYILSDSGSAYTPKGFASWEEALTWATGSEGFAAGIMELSRPVYRPDAVGFDGVEAANFFAASDLKHYQEQSA